MVERVCPSCQHGNAITDRFCGVCGTSLERMLPASTRPSPLASVTRQLPAHWQGVGKTVAISAAALVAEAGLAWLKRRLEGGNAPRQDAAIAPAQKQSVTITSKRVVDIWDDGKGHRRVVDQTFWRREQD